MFMLTETPFTINIENALIFDWTCFIKSGEFQSMAELFYQKHVLRQRYSPKVNNILNSSIYVGRVIISKRACLLTVRLILNSMQGFFLIIIC